MPTELPAQKTPISREEAVIALWRGWIAYFGSAPTPACIQIITAQWAIETGFGKSLWDYNFGNAKSRNGDGFDYTYFACNELLRTTQAQALAAADPEHAKIQANRPDGFSWIWFYPPHEGCRFRAFKSADEGALDHISLLARRFPEAIVMAQQGDARGYAHQLKVRGYYTADESQYAAGLIGCLKTIQALNIDYDALPVFSKDDIERLDNILAMSLLEAVDQAHLLRHFDFQDDADQPKTLDRDTEPNEM